MKVHHVIGGLVGLTVIAIVGVIYMAVSLITTGKAFPND